ncbi:MAG: tRNA uridine-5-carboxymethylaminomethyl(34) synthesis GTPase MnmE [Alphaproteobacteria bacterium]
MTTIYALSSGLGKAGVAVIRISGPQTANALRQLVGKLPPPRVASLKTLRHPFNGEVLDRGLVLWFPAPHSFTGEDMAELQVHGGRAVVECVLAALGGLDGLCLAQPGEFTRRAFENGKLDLTSAEGVADLIDAETAVQRRQAIHQSSGALQTLYEDWRGELISALAHVEAALDFSDEDDVPDTVDTAARPIAKALHSQISAHLADGRRGEIIRDGVRVVIAGPPNAGKSSLMNALAQRDVAIVSAQAGTTRDVIEVRLDLGGVPVILMDTAGLREEAGEIEGEGIRRALQCAEDADLVLWLNEAQHFQNGFLCDGTDDLPCEMQGVSRIIRVASKLDLISNAERSNFSVSHNAAVSGEGTIAASPKFSVTSSTLLPLSVHTGDGMDTLLLCLSNEAAFMVGSGESAVITRARHRQELQTCVTALEHFLLGTSVELELRAEDLRQAATALGRITGRVDVEDVLDKIFGDFCIGK